MCFLFVFLLKIFLPLSSSKEKKLSLRLQAREAGLDQSRGISEIKTREKWIGWPIHPKGIESFIVFSSTASWCEPVSCCNVQNTSNLLGHLLFQSQPSFLDLTARIRLQWQPWGALRGRSGTTWRQNYPTPSCLRCHSSLSRDFMGRAPISTVVNTFYQQELPALSDGCSFILVHVTIPESSSSLRITQSGSCWHFLRFA